MLDQVDQSGGIKVEFVKLPMVNTTNTAHGHCYVHVLTCCIGSFPLHLAIDQQLEGDTPTPGKLRYYTVNSGPALIDGYVLDAVKTALDVGKTGEVGPTNGDEVTSKLTAVGRSYTSRNQASVA